LFFKGLSAILFSECTAENIRVGFSYGPGAAVTCFGVKDTGVMRHIFILCLEPLLNSYVFIWLLLKKATPYYGVCSVCSHYDSTEDLFIIIIVSLYFEDTIFLSERQTSCSNRFYCAGDK
jgi:hypothetical protein